MASLRQIQLISRESGARRRILVLVLALVVGVATVAPYEAVEPIRYRFSFPEPQHRWMQVDASFPELGSDPLELRMSRSSPGRYSLHDFAKNVYDVRVFGADGREIHATRPDPSGWTVRDHGGTVTVQYKVFGDRVDGTYLAVDTTHAHINMPAAMMWARGLDDRPAVAHLRAADEARHGGSRRSFIQARRRSKFTAPNLQYLMDSPVEFGPIAMREFTVGRSALPLRRAPCRH